MEDRNKIVNKGPDCPIHFFGVYDGHSTDLIANFLASKLDEYLLDNLK